MENNNENGNSPNTNKRDYAMLDPDTLRKELEKADDELFALKNTNRQLFARAKTAEGFEQDEKGEWVKVNKPEPKPDAKKPKPKDEFDLGEKAYLRSSGIDPTEFDFVKKEMSESGITDVDKLLASGYFQSKLKETRDAKAVVDATPSATRGQTENQGAKTDYWLAKTDSELPPDTGENQQLRIDVVNARIARDRAAHRTL